MCPTLKIIKNNLYLSKQGGCRAAITSILLNDTLTQQRLFDVI